MRCLAVLDVCWGPAAVLSKRLVAATHLDGTGLVQLLLGKGSRPGQVGPVSADPHGPDTSGSVLASFPLDIKKAVEKRLCNRPAPRRLDPISWRG